MSDPYEIVLEAQPDEAVWTAIGGGLHEYNMETAGDDDGGRIALVLYAPDRSIAGGLIGATHWGWLSIDLMFVREDLRGRGHGRRLLQAAEDEARRRGATRAYLDTFTFQAPDFYAAQGYRVFGELPDFPAGHRRLYMTKKL